MINSYLCFQTVNTDNITVSETLQNETEGSVIRNTFKRKHSDSFDDHENTKKQKQNEKSEDEIKDEKESLQSENYVEKKEESVRPAPSEIKESNIAHLKDDNDFRLDKENELKPNSTLTKGESNEESKDLDDSISENEESQHDQSEISCEKQKTEDTAINTVYEAASESDTNSKNSDDSSPTGIDNESNGTPSVPEPEPITREEAKKHPKLYRLLRENENKNNGLRAKYPFSNISVGHHVAYGSKGEISKYISTCSSPYAAHNLLEVKRSRGNNRNGNNNDKIVEIDVNKLPLNVSIIDLTSEELREPYEVRDEETNRKFHKFARTYREVLLVGNIPANCLQYY
ncbi:probable serine/threonine-protein kinase DDB_G0278845 [Mytilus trossulus]|uniref:probable serine/threonine-protein kinase DDB_G0278845 n=1 Tax=Mytilus trossulus TaxID=6551 RepID=UPI00300641A8